MYSAVKAIVAALAVASTGRVGAQAPSGTGCIGEANFMCPSTPGSFIGADFFNPGNGASFPYTCTMSRSYCLDAPDEIPLTVFFGATNYTTMYLGKSSALNFTTAPGTEAISVYNGEPTDLPCQTTVAIACSGGPAQEQEPPMDGAVSWLLDGSPALTTVNLTDSLLSCTAERTPCVGGNQTDPILFSVQSAFYTAAPGALEPGQILQLFEGEQLGFTLADKKPDLFEPAFLMFATSDVASSKKACSSAAIVTCEALLAP